MQLSCSLAVEALMAVLLVTQAAAAPMAEAHHARGLEPRGLIRPKPVGSTCSDGWCRPNDSPPMIYAHSKPPPKGAPKGKFLGRREVADEDAAVVEKRANPLYETGIGGGKRPLKPSTLHVPKSKPAPGVSTKPKPAVKPVTKPSKPKTKREAVNEDAAIVEKRANPLYETGVGGGKRPQKPSTLHVPKSKPAPGVSTKPKPAVKPVIKPSKPRSRRDVDA